MTATWSTTLWLEDISQYDVSELRLARLIWQYRDDQPRLQAWLEAILDEVANLERVGFQILTETWPLTAIGEQLDTIGAIIGEPRGEKSDDLYRLFVLARILVNRSSGTFPEIIDILEIIGYPTIDVAEFWPCEIRVSVAGQLYGDEVADLIADTKAGGVTLRWVWSDVPAADTFQFANVLGDDDTDADSGFGDLGEVTQTTGGQFAGGGVY